MHPQELPVIIDAWAQHPTLRHINDPVFDSLKRWTKVGNLTEELPVELTIGQMDAAGIRKSLICAWEAPGKSMISNDEVASVVNSAPDRFVGIGSVDISHPMKAVREIHRCVKVLGFKGIRVLPWLWSKPPTDRWFYPVYTACCELGIPFCTQIGHTGPLMPSEVGRPIYLDQVALDFPELTIVAGHIGYPWTEEAIAVATKHAKVYIDTSAYTAKRYPPELVRYMKSHGDHKVLFGTNYPMISAEKALQDLDALELDKKTEQLFLAENAIRVFKLEC
ncbi:amidohydrolase family protein [uncultured Microbulbifer sp.]|uniref:amidohydrolase family protein n=1 Tax=uncultured Microbulbifer sp. TaxID=348147 RepID=UPI00261E6AD2|nr:amidohydrolase family protein [uncultured Microbulbifer sp.]